VNKIIQLVLISIVVSSCNFDEDRQLSLKLPATLEIKNETKHLLKLESIYSTFESEGGFVLSHQSVDAGGILNLNISESTYNSVREGHFVFEGQCGNFNNWRKEGTKIPKKIIDNDSQLKIILTIADCNI